MKSLLRWDGKGVGEGHETIVAEISKSWIDGDPCSHGTIGTLFENVVEANRQRGYTLGSWEFSQVVSTGREGQLCLTEGILAVFNKTKSDGSKNHAREQIEPTDCQPSRTDRLAT